MNEGYEEARMDVVAFQVMDVITTSGAHKDPPPLTDEWIPHENEGAPDYNAFVDLV